MNGSVPEEIGSYRVVQELGRGGMGVVYLATDTRLDRQVAIKALPAELASDPARLDRFEREAKTLAQLNHPNLAGIHGVEEQDGAKYLVLEYVEGETLAEMLDRGPIPVDQAIELAVQIAAGVEAAHEAGVIHRDLKPGNIIVTPERHAKVLDFGLARVEETSSSSTGPMSESPTLTSPAIQHSPTMPGVILGTAAYMSPEQARGRKVDKRTDIWSFGVLLYEMLTGIGPFRGETVTDSIGAILHKDVDLDKLPPQTPTNVRRALRRSLERDKSLRYRDIGDVRLELAASERVAPRQGMASSPRPILGVAVMALILGVFLGALLWQWRSPSGPSGMSSVRRASINYPSDFTIDNSFAISPDGSVMVFAPVLDNGDRRLYLRRLDSFENVPLAGTEAAQDPFFSPDGKWIGFSSQGRLRRMPLSGGRPDDICEGASLGAHWTNGGEIIFGTFGGGLARVSASGGTPALLTTLDPQAGEISHAYPHLMPDGDTVVFTVATGEGSRLDTLSLATGDRAVLAGSGSAFTHLFQDVVAFGVHGEVRVARFDSRRRNALETVVSILNGISWFSLGGAESAGYAVGRDGTLVYSSGDFSRATSSVVIVDDHGVLTPVDLPEGRYLHPEISPDGRSIAICKIDRSTETGDIWVVDIERGSASRLTSKGANYTPIWTPDGEHITFVSNGNIVSIPADGSGQPEVLFADDSYDRPLSWSPDGRSLVFSAGQGSLLSKDLMLLGSDGIVQPLLQTDFDERQASISPNGGKVAYISNETGRYEVYIRTFPEMTHKVLVSDNGGVEPIWSRDGAHLFYRNGDRVRRVRVTADPPISISESVTLFETKLFMQQAVRNFGVFPEADRFIMIDSPDFDDIPEFRVVYNWFAEVRDALQRAER